MAKETEQKKERPNRSRYAERFSKAHPNVDFEDNEARYAAMNEDRDLLDLYEESGNALGEVFDNNAWIGSMVMALRDNKDLDPITWMAEQGIDISQALEDDEYRKTISQKISDYQQNQLEGKKADKERETNLQASADALSSLGLDNEENLKMWKYLFEEVIDPALRGEVSVDVWKMIQKANNYDTDVESARNEGAMKARNEKIQNKLRQPSEQLPPDLSSGARGTTQTPKKKGPSFAQSFFEGVE